jgi:hypothetical protein
MCSASIKGKEAVQSSLPEYLKTPTVLMLEHFCCATSEVRWLSGKPTGAEEATRQVHRQHTVAVPELKREGCIDATFGRVFRNVPDGSY